MIGQNQNTKNSNVDRCGHTIALFVKRSKRYDSVSGPVDRDGAMYFGLEVQVSMKGP